MYRLEALKAGVEAVVEETLQIGRWGSDVIYWGILRRQRTNTRSS